MTKKTKAEIIYDADYFMGQMNKQIADSLSYEQKKEVKSLLGRAVYIPSKKIIDFNMTFWFLKKLYLAFYVGEDKRQKEHFETSVSYYFIKYMILLSLVLFILFIVAVILFSFLYTIKSALGINIFPKEHLSDIIGCIKSII